MTKPLIFSLFLAIRSLSSQAQAAVYVCSSTGKFGYCYGHSNVSNCAYNNCIAKGAISPYPILKVIAKGYGAIALGYTTKGRRIVGAAAGHPSRAAAQCQAIAKCAYWGGSMPIVITYWLDK